MNPEDASRIEAPHIEFSPFPVGIYDRDAALDFLLLREGYYANHPKDPGGETWRGIARKFWGAWDGWEVVDHEKRQGGNWQSRLKRDERLEALVRDFYVREFWLPNRCDQMPYGVALPLFDFAVNAPAVVARKALQRVVDAQPDGVIGPKTLEQLDRCVRMKGAVGVGRDLLGRRRDRFAERIASGQSSAVFLKGWWRRLDHVRDEIHNYAMVTRG